MRLLTSLLTTALAATLLTFSPPLAERADAARYAAPEGPFFNDPRGSAEAQLRIERQVLAAIRATPRRGTIRIAIYSFDRMPVARALAAANRRGVKVQLLLNDHQDTKAMRYLRQRLGSHRWKGSFIYACRSGCRSAHPDRNLHSKFYTFTSAGRSERVLMVGSADQVFPRRSTRNDDPVLAMLGRVQCLNGDRRTRLDLSMHTMRGQRGNYLAAAIRRKHAEGCRVRVSYGLIGWHTKQILGKQTSRGRVPLRSTGFDRDGDGEVEIYTHQKYLVIRGAYAGDPDASLTLTGSSNWASLGTAQDEVFFTVRGAGVAEKYVRNFNHMWRGTGNSRPAYTTTYASFRSLFGVPVTTVEPDGLRPGATWESD